MKKIVILLLTIFAPLSLFAEDYLLFKIKIDNQTATFRVKNEAVFDSNNCKENKNEFKMLYNVHYEDICLLMESVNQNIIVMPQGFPRHNPIKEAVIDVFLVCNGKSFTLYSETDNNGIVSKNQHRMACTIDSLIEEGSVL